MKPIFEEYGGVILVVLVIIALVGIVTALSAGGDSSYLGEMFKNLFTNMQSNLSTAQQSAGV